MTNSGRGLAGGGWRARFGGGRAATPVPVVTHPPLALRDAERTLTLFVTGLTDGLLAISGNAEATESGAYTDGRTIFLPERVAHAPTRVENLRVYKALIAHTAAQRLYGTLELDGALERLRDTPDQGLQLALFDLVEGARLAARLAVDYPGIGRDLAMLGHASLSGRTLPAAQRGRAQALEALLRGTLGQDEASFAGLRGRTLETVRATVALLPAAETWPRLTRSESIDLARLLHERVASLGPGALPGPLLGHGRVRLDRLRREILLPPPVPPRREEEPVRFKVPS
ncbi:MAG TPA: hypothetical protein VIL85_07455, partial [Thermomicrobiales bacterium]